MTKWKKFAQDSYLDMQNIIKYEGNIYKCWIKNNANSNKIIETDLGKNTLLGYTLTEILIDIKNYKVATKETIIYDINRNIVEQNCVANDQLLWTDIQPRSVGSILYNLLKNKFIYQDDDWYGLKTIICRIISLLLIAFVFSFIKYCILSL